MQLTILQLQVKNNGKFCDINFGKNLDTSSPAESELVSPMVKRKITPEILQKAVNSCKSHSKNYLAKMMNVKVSSLKI